MVSERLQLFKVVVVAVLLLPRTAPAQSRSIDDFFRGFASAWVRHDPFLATFTRYFAGADQERLERQLTPETVVYKRDRIRRAKQGLTELRKFDRSKMTEEQRVSADVMQWQLQMIVDEERYLDYTFPLEQFQGANVSLINALVVVHPLVTALDAENYIAALRQLGMRMEEAMERSQQLVNKGIQPPKFILQATIEQMKRQ